MKHLCSVQGILGHRQSSHWAPSGLLQITQLSVGTNSQHIALSHGPMLPGNASCAGQAVVPRSLHAITDCLREEPLACFQGNHSSLEHTGGTAAPKALLLLGGNSSHWTCFILVPSQLPIQRELSSCMSSPIISLYSLTVMMTKPSLYDRAYKRSCVIALQS